jgi:hypothetical protein
MEWYGVDDLAQDWHQWKTLFEYSNETSGSINRWEIRE